jgi:hypothetical protein
VLAILGLFLAPILAWFSDQVYRLVLTRCASHPLIRLAQFYDPAALVAACASYYHAPGTKGAPPTFTLDQLVRAEIVRAWADSCGDPDLEWLLASNLIARWFVGLPLLGPTPDHSTLNRFHAWLTAHQPSAFFLHSLAFLDHVDPEPPATTPQIVDTFAMASPAAPTPSASHLLGQLTLRLLQLWRTQAPVPLPAALPPLDPDVLRHPQRWRTTLERQQQLQTAVQTARHLAACFTLHLTALAPPDQASAQILISAIHKVIADETSTDASGLIQERPNEKKGTYRLMSAIDLEATFRKHEGSPAVFGTNAVLSTTATRIRAAVALTGSTPDSEAPAAVIRQLQATNQPLPADLIMDQAGGWGKSRAQVLALSAGQTQVVAYIPQSGGADLSRFTPADFQVDAERTACTCPGGVTSTKVYASGDGDGVHFRFLASQCRECPLWTDCRGAESNPKGHRTVFVSDYHSVLRAAARFNATEAGKLLLKGRWRVEPTIAWLVRYQGCRSARRVGLAAAQCQLFQACAVRNLLLWLSRLDRGLARSPDAALRERSA